MRVIVTGSRDWIDQPTIYHALNLYCARHLPDDLTLVHGACPTGADAIADLWGEHYAPGHVERHPADWDAFGKMAGPMRNSEMVNLGADLCLAFLKDGSTGTQDTITKAVRAKIRTVIYPI